MFTYGNWCGPGWSNGLAQTSVRGDAIAIDDFDETCRNHDFAYADNSDLKQADYQFFKQNFGNGFTRSLAAVAVGLQGLSRPDDKHPQNLSQNIMTKNKNLRTAAVKPQQQQITAKSRPRSSTNTVGAPVAIGSVVRNTRPTHIQTKNGSILRGTDFISPVECQGVTTFGLGKSAMLSPAYFLGTFIGNMSRSYEKYRWNRLRIHYIPKVATSANGQVVLCSSHSVSEPCLAGEAGTFLQRAMSQGNASLGPLWMANYIDIECKKDYLMVDPAITSDPDDSIAEELQVYTQSTVSGQVGYLYAEYELEFSEMTFQPHSTSLPIPTGPGLRVSLVDENAVNAAGDDWRLTDPSGGLNLPNIPNGTIFRAVFDIQGSAAYTGGTFSTGYDIGVNARSAITTLAQTTSTLVLRGGTTVYFLVYNTGVQVYGSLEAAINGIGSGQIFMHAASTAQGLYAFDTALIRLGLTTLPQVQ